MWFQPENDSLVTHFAGKKDKYKLRTCAVALCE